MAGRYGMSFARELIERGDYEEAVTAATEAIDAGKGGPEPWFDRGTAHELLENYVEAAADLERAITENVASKEMDPFQIDDAYFTVLVQAATHAKEAGRISDAVAFLARYDARLPNGHHKEDAALWTSRMRGETTTLLDKTTAM
ncbi:MAG: tetratricopeptide repeat protein [Polyangiaceae bacterium]